jgi:hypothetical protein
MGGKDSGGGGQQYPTSYPEGTRSGGMVWDSSAEGYGSNGNWVREAEYDAKQALKASQTAAEPEAAEVAAPEPAAAAAPDPLANMPAAPATDSTLAPPTSLGGTPAPGAGDSLGGAILKPPRYWTGGLDQYESAHRTGRGGAGAGSIRTTQT